MRVKGRLAGLVAAAAAAVALLAAGGSATAAAPSATLVGDLQSEAGCPGDWDPACTATHLADIGGGVYRLSVALPAGSYQYKVAINDSWDENYGAHATPGGDNIGLHLDAAKTVTFYYDSASHWITDDVNSTIVTTPGSYQSELGCPGDWQPECFRSWLEDIDGDGVYTLTTTSLPAGSYEFKAALNGSWDVNYGAGGVPGGPNIGFSVPTANAKVTFSYNAASHVPTVLSGHGHDSNVEWDGLGFDSRSTLYRSPQGAVKAGTPVLLRFRTFHDDVTSVRVRLWDVNASAQTILTMTRVSSGANCLTGERCDYWQATLPTPQADVYWYRFIVQDGTATAYYGDDQALDGGTGQTTANEVDNSFALTAYDPSFTVPSWAASAVVYQVFPDRFFNGDRKNDPKTTDALYDTHPTLKAWSDKPEGYCRSYTTPCSEGPHGTDYFGGDLKGLRQKLDWIHDNGFNTLYLNPIFWAKSNHRYDTADYFQIDPYLGDLKDFTQLVTQAHELGMHIVLDGVFNHMSSDSPLFDRYHHYTTDGACESASSQWRAWFTFTGAAGPCVGGAYTGWAGFDSIPVLTKSLPAVQQYFLTGADSVTKHWLRAGSNGWRLDVMGDPSFPAGYWETFRDAVKQTDPDALIIGELWQKDSTLLRLLDGSGADTTMNYRLRDALLGLLVPPGGHYDGKGFPDSGHSLSASHFAARMLSQQEDYAPQVYAALMNLVDSHDTARALWDLTPGAASAADKEQNATNLAEGKRRLRLGALVQYTVPGMPTVYYGDEVGVTGGDDPDNRRTMPWGKEDGSLQAYYRQLGGLRATRQELVGGDFRILQADDATGTLAYGRKIASGAALVALNTSGSERTLAVPVGGFLPDGTQLARAGVSGGTGSAAVAGGTVSVTLPALSGAVLLTGTVDLEPPAAPSGLATADVGAGSVALHWNAVDGAASYAVYRSPVTLGGYVKLDTVAGTSFTDTSVQNGINSYYVVRALDAGGNESGNSNEVSALPSLPVVWANVQWPPTIDEQLQASGWTVYGQVYVPGITDAGGSADLISAQLGWGDATDRAGWQWVDATFNAGHCCDSNYEYMAQFRPSAPGTYYYGYRYSTNGGATWKNAGPGGPDTAPGVAHISPPADMTAPATPTGLHVVSAGPTEIDLAWDANTEPDLFGYEVWRSGTKVGTPTSPSFADTTVVNGTTYTYVVKAVDNAVNVSGASSPVTAKAALRNVSVVFTVTVPAGTPDGSTVHVAGSFGDLDPSYPTWDPAGLPMTQLDATHWTITLSGLESTHVEYKYTLGSWDFVEKGSACDELGNRVLTVSYGSTGTQNVNDSVANWRAVAPCGS
jgi:glycosidase